MPPDRVRRAAARLYAAWFTTAFGAHAIAANLGGYSRGLHEPLLVLGVLLALYEASPIQPRSLAQDWPRGCRT